MPHQFECRVYYEDTDLAGIVYYANYLKFIERARTEFIRSRALDQTRLRQDLGVVFVVRHLECDYHQPAKFDDLLIVATSLLEMTGARLMLQQTVTCTGRRLFSANVTLACVAQSGGPVRIPADIRRKLRPNSA